VGLINPAPPLEVGDAIRWKHAAVYSTESHTIGGMLYVTNRYLVFAINRVEVRRRFGPVSVPLTRVASIGIQDRTGQAGNGGMRRRVRIALENGEVHLFVFNHPDKILAELQRFITPR